MNKLHVLMVEDSPSDGDLLAMQLRRSGLDCECERVDTAKGVKAALQSGEWHVALIDFNLPSLNALDVLKIIRERGLDIPCIVVSGMVGEEAAAQTMKAGAHDLVLKQNLARLGAAVRREVEAANDRKRTATMLRQSEERYHRIVDLAQEGIWFLDRDARTVFVNESMAIMLGLQREEIVGQPFDVCLFEEDVPDHHLRFKRRQKGVAEKYERRIRHRDGHAVWTMVAATPVLDDQGGFIGSFAMFTDITDLKRVEAERERLLADERAARLEAERINRVKDEFLATLSHEIRTPLNAIFGWSHMLRAHKLPPERLRQGIETIERNARAQARLIDDMLDVSRILSGCLVLDIQKVDLRTLIQSALESLSSATKAKDIQFTQQIDSTATIISADPVRLQQVIWNLLSNAVKFTPHSGRVRIASRRVREQLEIEVSDTGIGIKPEFTPYLFKRFYQADASITRRFGGLGLGLAIVRHIVELHGGTVNASSPGENLGATFRVRIPLEIGRRENAVVEVFSSEEKPSSNAGPHDLRGTRVLVVDDEPDARDLIYLMLENQHVQVEVASSAKEGMALLQLHVPDVLISDIAMPEEDGFAFIQKVRALLPERGGAVPAVALTALTRTEDRRRALSAGFQAYVEKPVEPDLLISHVASLARRA